MPALRTRDANPGSPTDTQDPSQTLTAPSLQLISPTPRTLIFPTSHSLSLGALDASPYSSPSHSPFQGADGYDGGYDGGYEYDNGGGNAGYDGGVNANAGYDGGNANYDNGNGNGNAGFEYGAYDKYEGQSATFTFTAQPNDSAASLSFYAHPQANGSSASFHSQPYHIESPGVHPGSQMHHGGAGGKNGSQLSLSLTIPELPNFAPQPYSASPSDPSSDTASLRSSSPSGSIHSHKRRKSTSSAREASTERRPKKGDADYVKRPENAFILFRRAACEERQAAEAEAQSRGGAPAKKQRQADLSKAISEKWRSLSGEEKRVWEERAKEKKEEHAKANPGYVYRPERKSKKSSAAASSSSSTSQRRPSLSRARRGSEDSSTSLDSPHLSVFVPMRMPSHHAHSASVSLSAGSSLDAPQTHGGGVHRNGRSSSAPRPYHRIDVPLVNHGMGLGMGGARFKREGSEPTSPSLVPLINEHSRQGGGWDYVPPTKSFTLPGGGGSSEYPSMSMVSSLFQQNTPASAPANGRKSSAPSPLQQIAMQHTSGGAPTGPSPLSLIAPPPNTVSSTLTSKAPLDNISTTNGSDGSDSGNSSPQTGPFTPSALAPGAFMMPNFETLLEPPSSAAFDSLIDPALQDMPSSHMVEDLDPMGMTGIEGMDEYGVGFGMGLGMGTGMGMGMGMGYGGGGAFGTWDWPAGEGTLDNNWDVNSIPLASMSPSSLSSPPLSSSSLSSPPLSSSLSPPNSSNSNSNSNGGSATSQLAAQFGSMGVGNGNGNGKGVGAYDEGMYATMGDPTLMVGGYDDILAGGAFA